MNFRKIAKTLWRPLRAQIIAKADMQRAKEEILLRTDLSENERAILGSLELEIHGNDSMYVSFHGSHYLEVGLSAGRCILDVLHEINISVKNIKKILDFPCGYGRVLRFLQAVFPGAEITGADRDLMALGFCQSRFDIQTFSPSIKNKTAEFEKKYDLIWCGSLITHLPQDEISTLLEFFYESLEPGGLCIFSTHGDLIAEVIKNKPRTYRLSNNQGLRIYDDYKNSGYGFGSYGKDPNYGISVVSPEKMTLIASGIGNWSPVYCKPRMWDNHHDIYAYRKNDAAFECYKKATELGNAHVQNEMGRMY